MEEVKTKRARFELSVETKAIRGLLSQLEIGETIDYATLSKAVDRDITKYRQPVYTAMISLRKDFSMEFINIRGVGYKRLADNEKISSMGVQMQKARKAASRGKKIAHSVNMDNLNNIERTEYLRSFASCSVIDSLLQKKSQEKLDKLLEEPENQTKLLISNRDMANSTLELLKKVNSSD